jgi:hypothetical protein
MANIKDREIPSPPRRRGRPPRLAAAVDFILGDADASYWCNLEIKRRESAELKAQAKTARNILPEGEASPSELAYRATLQEMKADLPNIDWRSLRNAVSLWRLNRYPKPSF